MHQITKFNDSHLVLQLSLTSPLKPVIKSRLKMYVGQRRKAMLQLHLSDQQFYCLQWYPEHTPQLTHEGTPCVNIFLNSIYDLYSVH